MPLGGEEKKKGRKATMGKQAKGKEDDDQPGRSSQQRSQSV